MLTFDQKHRQFLHFPNRPRFNRPHSGTAERLPPVSEQAINLIQCLIADREKRLSCRTYRENDLQLRGRSGRATRCQSRGVFFVCINDAEDIKSHPFFQGIDWDTLHLSRPPWIPRIKEGQDLAKYFEDEDQILSQSEHSSSSFDERPNEVKHDREPKLPELVPKVPAFGIPERRSSHNVNAMGSSVESTLMPYTQPLQLQLVLISSLVERKLHPQGTPIEAGNASTSSPQPSNSTVASKLITSPPKYNIAPPAEPALAFLGPAASPTTTSATPHAATKSPKKKKPRDRKRPRDKILRDPQLAWQAMEVRKRTAFLGYTYRRCDVPGLLDAIGFGEDERRIGRRLVRGSVWGVTGVMS